jgi:phosphoglycolate phosphatase
MQKTVLFDLDGTLSDTAVDLVHSLNTLLTRRNLPNLSFEEARSTAGKGGRALIELGYRKSTLTSPDIEKDIQEFLQIYTLSIEKNPRLFDGALEAVKDLKSNGWVLGICSNKPERLCHKLLDSLDLKEYFPVIVGGDTLSVRKPDPEHIFETIRRLNGQKSQTILVGDTITDKQAAQNAGIDCILFGGGYAEHPVESYHPEGIFHHFHDLPKIMNEKYADWV